MKNRSPKERARWFAPIVLAIAMTVAGCGAEMIAFAVLVGKAMVYIAAVKLTVALVDSALGNKAQDPQADFVPDSSNKDRGTYRSLTFQKKTDKGQKIGKPIVLVDVPVYRGSDGLFHIDSDYLRKVDDAIKKAERE